MVFANDDGARLRGDDDDDDDDEADGEAEEDPGGERTTRGGDAARAGGVPGVRDERGGSVDAHGEVLRQSRGNRAKKDANGERREREDWERAPDREADDDDVGHAGRRGDGRGSDSVRRCRR